MLPSPGAPVTARSVLKDVFGYDSFRENQETIVETLIAGSDIFALMPTGSGKSLCYQIPSIVRPGVGVVISPLIALMQDQVEDLRQNGVEAYFLNSSLPYEDARRVEQLAVEGKCDLLYVAPERLLTGQFQRLLDQLNPALFAIDEAHCVSQWGHDFRPEYLRIAEVTGRFPGVPRIALTATADQATRFDITSKLQLANAKHVIASFDRPNIFYRVRLKHRDKQQLLTVLKTHGEGVSGIVYVRTRKRVESIAAWLTSQGIPALPYHAGLDAATRADNQQQFQMHDGIVMVATVAFGMGIDKPDIRCVIHLDLPSSMEAYYQETGRAGRDGEPATAWLFYSMADVISMRALQQRSEGPIEFQAVQQRKLNAFLGFCESPECRRKTLLDYFGEAYDAPCNACDNCTEVAETWDGTIAAQKALSCVYRTGQRFGAAYLIDVLTGNATPRMQRFGHDAISTFGVGTDLTPGQWHSVFRQLLAAGYLDTDLASKRGFKLTERSRGVLSQGETVRFRQDPQPLTGSRPTRRRGRQAAEIEIDPSNPKAVALWESLRDLRLELSKDLGVPPYVIFHDRTLKAMVADPPTRRDGLLEISGVGQTKLERFGDQFFQVIEEWRE